MKLYIIGSSSSGNSYLLQSETTGEVLAIEAGVKFDKVKKALDYKINHIVGCIVSHEHGDHAKAINDFLKACIPVFASKGTLEAKGLDYTMTNVFMVSPLKRYKIGGFEIMPFDVQHDAAQPLGYLIKHPECGTVLFATDTYYLKYRFDGLSNWMIECNYRQDILQRNFEAGKIDPKRRDRTIKSHMSYETLRETLAANDLTKTNRIILIHLSADNSNAREFVQGISAATLKNTVAARAGDVLDFNKTPY